MLKLEEISENGKEKEKEAKKERDLC